MKLEKHKSKQQPPLQREGINHTDRKPTVTEPRLPKDNLPVPKKGSYISLVTAACLLAGALSLVFGESLFSPTASDELTNAERVQIQSQFENALANGASALVPVNFLDPVEREKAKVAIGLPEKEAEQLMLEAEGGRLSLAWVTLWDNLAEDGDVVTVEANGMTHTVPILNSPTTIVVPYSVNSPSLTITGTHDGGGGITIAARTESGALPLPPMNVGESKVLRFK
jgi:hypothetical protein